MLGEEAQGEAGEADGVHCTPQLVRCPLRLKPRATEALAAGGPGRRSRAQLEARRVYKPMPGSRGPGKVLR